MFIDLYSENLGLFSEYQQLNFFVYNIIRENNFPATSLTGLKICCLANFQNEKSCTFVKVLWVKVSKKQQTVIKPRENFAVKKLSLAWDSTELFHGENYTSFRINTVTTKLTWDQLNKHPRLIYKLPSVWQR